MKRDGQQMKFPAFRDRKKTLTILAKEFKTNEGMTILKNSHRKAKRKGNYVNNMC